MSTQQHLLMIEDDQRLADMVVTYLGNNGLSVAHCPDATSGLQQLQRQPLPDLLILDLMLPDLDGLEVCRRLRALPGAAAEVPVLMLTAKGDPMDRVVGLEIDRDARLVTVNGQAAEMTSYQFDLLVALAERAGRVLTRDQIMEVVRGRELEAFDRSIDVHMGRIRAAIELDPKNPKRILTVRGVGYVFAKQQD